MIGKRCGDRILLSSIYTWKRWACIGTDSDVMIANDAREPA
jgi:hypothetical protein